MVQRLTYRRRHSFATKSNKQRLVKTPGEAGARGGGETGGRGGRVMARGCTVLRCNVGAPAHTRTTLAGGKLQYQLLKKNTTHPSCPISGQRLNGVSWAGLGLGVCVCVGGGAAAGAAAGRARSDGDGEGAVRARAVCALARKRPPPAAAAAARGCAHPATAAAAAAAARLHARPTRPAPPARAQLPAIRPARLHTLSKSKKTIHRAYGGHLAAGVVRERIVRAFLVEEQKIVKKVRACVRAGRTCASCVCVCELRVCVPAACVCVRGRAARAWQHGVLLVGERWGRPPAAAAWSAAGPAAAGN